MIALVAKPNAMDLVLGIKLVERFKLDSSFQKYLLTEIG
jgi:hypothetical protein